MLLAVVGGVVAILFANVLILSSVSSKIYTDIQTIDYSDVALVLGTSQSVNGRTENPFFTYRITAAAELFFQGKVKHILVSGDNSSMHYNEPRDMRHALIKLGVPDSCITMDFAGLQKRITIVSQEFHNYRALFIANHYGIDAIAYNAVYPEQVTMKTILREYLARPKALLDLYLLHTQPKFLGDKVTIRV